jgi:hypothetical protein
MCFGRFSISSNFPKIATSLPTFPELLPAPNPAKRSISAPSQTTENTSDLDNCKNSISLKTARLHSLAPQQKNLSPCISEPCHCTRRFALVSLSRYATPGGSNCGGRRNRCSRRKNARRSGPRLSLRFRRLGRQDLEVRQRHRQPRQLGGCGGLQRCALRRPQHRPGLHQGVDRRRDHPAWGRPDRYPRRGVHRVQGQQKM